MTSPHTITLLSRPGCHLCDEARSVIDRVARDLGVSWTERDITTSPDDLREYADMIPVTFVDGVQHDFWRVSESRLRQVLGGLPAPRSVRRRESCHVSDHASRASGPVAGNL